MFLNIKTAGCRDAIHCVTVKTKGKWLDALDAMNRVFTGGYSFNASNRKRNGWTLGAHLYPYVFVRQLHLLNNENIMK